MIKTSPDGRTLNSIQWFGILIELSRIRYYKSFSSALLNCRIKFQEGWAGMPKLKGRLGHPWEPFGFQRSRFAARHGLECGLATGLAYFSVFKPFGWGPSTSCGDFNRGPALFPFFGVFNHLFGP